MGISGGYLGTPWGYLGTPYLFLCCNDPNYGGPDSVKSKDISDGEEAYFETTVSGAGWLKFYWKVSSESGGDYLRFYIDDVLQHSITGDQPWAQKSYLLSSGSTVKWSYVKDGSDSDGDDCGYVDRVEWNPTGSGPTPILEQATEAEEYQLTFTDGGDADWTTSSVDEPVYYGDNSAESGDIDNSETSEMETTYTASAGDIVSFYWKVSSESGGDYLRFEIDDVEQSGSISGEQDWQKKSFSLSAGSRTLTWIYDKDSGGTDGGDDCGWVDGLYVGPSSGSLPPDPEGPGAYAEAVDSSLKFTTRADDDDVWVTDSGFDSDYYYDGDADIWGHLTYFFVAIMSPIA